MIAIRPATIGRPSVISEETRNAIIERYNNSNRGYKSIAKEFGIPAYVVSYLIKKLRKEYEMGYMCAEGEE